MLLASAAKDLAVGWTVMAWETCRQLGVGSGAYTGSVGLGAGNCH